MPLTTWTTLLASLVVTGEPGAPKTVERLLKEKGPPLFSARSASLQGRRLVVWVDARGFVRRTRAATVTEVELADGKPGTGG
jgi:hypothetical protein